MRRILIIQTAFAGDLILTTPLLAETARCFPDAAIDVLCIPATAPLLQHHPGIRNLIVYDKRRRSPRLMTMMRTLRGEGYDLCLSPHRSLRTALLSWATGAGIRVAFDRAAGSRLYTHRVPYDSAAHEVVRNLRLLEAAGCHPIYETKPALYPSEPDYAAASEVIRTLDGRRYTCIAPGSVWATKRWTEEGFAETARVLADSTGIVLIGGPEDRERCERIEALAGVPAVNAAGMLSLNASAALIDGASLLISNDSAPVHMASAVGTPVVEIFGATVPEFGFTPIGVAHRIVQREGLSCKPCAIHGGDACPIHTFECMRRLSARDVIAAATDLLLAT